MRPRYSLWIMIFLVLFSPLNASLAADDLDNKEQEDQQSDVFTLGDVVVEAKSTLTKGDVARVNEEELRQFDRNDLAEALDLMPGITLCHTGARNERTIYVRGFDLKHVPLFIDGIPVYVMYDGYSDLGRFTTFDTSQIVVSKGAASVLYGFNTLGGAVNVVTKRPEKALEANAGVGMASGDTTNAYANVGTNQDKWYLQAGGSYMDQDHYILSKDYQSTETEDGDKRLNSYRTDQKYNLKLGLTPVDEDEYALSYSKQEAEKGSPPYAGDDPSERVRYWQWPQWDKESFYFNSKTTVGGKSYLKTRVYYDLYDNSLFSYDDDTYTSQESRSSFQSWYNDQTLGGSLEIGAGLWDDNDLKLALHYKKDQHKEHDDQEPKRTFQDQYYSVGLEDTIILSDRFDIVLGASYDWQNALKAEDYDSDTNVISDFPTHNAQAFNPQAKVNYYLSDLQVFYASLARKSRFPTLKDRYSYRMGYGLPNTELDPEIATNYEAGYTIASKTFNVESSVFFSDIKDYILLTSIVDPSDSTATLDQNQNVGEVYLYGIEAQAEKQFTDALDGGFSYTYTQWDNRSGSDKIIDIPAHKVNVYIHSKLWERVSLTVDAQHYSGRYSSSDGVRKTESFTLANAKMDVALLSGVAIEGGVKNMFDQDYEIEEGYPEAGVNYFANLTYRY